MCFGVRGREQLVTCVYRQYVFYCIDLFPLGLEVFYFYFLKFSDVYMIYPIPFLKYLLFYFLDLTEIGASVRNSQFFVNSIVKKANFTIINAKFTIKNAIFAVKNGKFTIKDAKFTIDIQFDPETFTLNS